MLIENENLRDFLSNYLRGPFAGKVSQTNLGEMFLEENPDLDYEIETVRVTVGRILKELTDKKPAPTPSVQPLQFELPKAEAPPINVTQDIIDRIEANRKEAEYLLSLSTKQEEEYVPLLKSINKPVEEKTEGTHLVIGCLHIPFHNKKLWNAFLAIASDLGEELKSVNLIGDITDMHSISRHAKGKITIPGLTLGDEYQATNKELDKLQEAIHSATNKHYLYGNHEDWYHQHMAEVNNWKLGKEVIMSPLEAMDYRKRGFTVQTNWKEGYITLGDIELIHGTYCGVHSCKKHLEVMKRNVAYVHTHSIGCHTEDKIASYNIGWGGDKSSKAFGYMTRIQKEKWRNGFASVYVDNTGKSHLNQLELINGGVHFRGKIYK